MAGGHMIIPKNVAEIGELAIEMFETMDENKAGNVMAKITFIDNKTLLVLIANDDHATIIHDFVSTNKKLK